MHITKGTTIQVKQRQDCYSRSHALHQVTLVIGLPVRLGAENWTVKQDVDRMIQTAAIVSVDQIQEYKVKTYLRMTIWLGGLYGGRSVGTSLR